MARFPKLRSWTVDAKAPFFLICGPFVIESSDNCLKTAEQVATALTRLEKRRITCSMVTDEAGRLIGVLHRHDLWEPASGEQT